MGRLRVPSYFVDARLAEDVEVLKAVTPATLTL
jgi:hypothetical protein